MKLPPSLYLACADPLIGSTLATLLARMHDPKPELLASEQLWQRNLQPRDIVILQTEAFEETVSSLVDMGVSVIVLTTREHRADLPPVVLRHDLPPSLPELMSQLRSLISGTSSPQSHGVDTRS